MLKKLGHAIAALLFTSGIAFAAFNLGFDGKLMPVGSGTLPVLSGCGTGTMAAGSSDVAGTFTATGATGCTLTFNVPYATAPSCVVTELTVNTALRTTAVTATTIVVAAGTSGSSYSYVCAAKAGG